MAKNKNIDLTRVNMNLPTSIVNRVKEFGDSLGLNTTSAYIVLLNQALDQKSMMDSMPGILNMVDKLQTLENIKLEDSKKV